MKFFSRYRNPTYVIEPRDYEWLGNRRRLVPGQGIRVEFTPMAKGSMLDTEAEQAKHGWNDATRERVEHYLMAHQDFGHGMYLADATVEKAVRPSSSTCRVIIPVEGGVRLCGKGTDGGDICAEHTKLLGLGEPESQAPTDEDEEDEDQDTEPAAETKAPKGGRKAEKVAS